MTRPRSAHLRSARAGRFAAATALALALVLALGSLASAARPRHHPKPRPPVLSLYARRALAAYEAMQQNFYVPAVGLYKGEPEYSFLWPFSQALAASVSVSNIPGQRARLVGGLRALATGLQVYASPPLGEGEAGVASASTPRSFTGVVAPPVGPGGDSFYDDNEWVGIELVRMYGVTHEPADLLEAEQIMGFVMSGWQTTGAEGQPLPCPGGVPFSNATGNKDRNAVTDAPAAELGVRLYQLTHEARYLQFAEEAYGWVRQCLLVENGLYADHIDAQGRVNPALWSYNQGSMMGAGALLYQATHEGVYLYQARQTARGALAAFPYSRLSSENPFFVSVYLRNLMYLDAVTHDPPGAGPAREYAYYAWQRHRLSNDLFAYGAPPTAELLGQAALVQVYAMLSTPPRTYF